MDSITTTKTIKTTGNSLVLFLTKELDSLGLDKEDMVKVTLERVE